MNKNLTNNTNTELSNSNYPDFDSAIWDDAIDLENIVVDEADTAEDLDTYDDCLDDSEELDDFDEADDEYYEDWQADTICDLAIRHGVEERIIEEKIQDVRSIFTAEKVYIPMESCLLQFRDLIGEKLYDQYRDDLIAELDDNPYLIEKLDLTLFHDRELAKSVLKCSFAMDLLKEYQDDDEMVRYALECNGETIQYVDERYINDRDWVKLAIEHSENSAIMYLKCMEQYRSDRELVYLACKVHPYNFTAVDEVFHDDYDLVHMILSAENYKQSIISRLSDRLKDDVSIALLALKTDCVSGFDMNDFSVLGGNE